MRTLRVVLMADTHLGFDLPRRPRAGIPHRGEDFFANFERVLRHVRETRPQLVVHGGDVFFRSRVDPAVAERAYGALAGVADAGIPVVVVPGNHDASRLPVSLWLGHPNIHALLEPQTIRLRLNGIEAAIAGFPFVRGDFSAKFEAVLAATGLADAPGELRLLCIHQAFAGAAVGPNGYRFPRGGQNLERRALPQGISAVLAGHIHRAQILHGDAGPPVIYPGSTERTSFAERNETKGFFDLAFAAHDGEPARLAEAKFVELPARPMHDVEVPHHPGLDLAAFLRGAARSIPERAVVRITAGVDPPPGLVRQLTARFLRECFPPTMQLQLSKGLIDAFD